MGEHPWVLPVTALILGPVLSAILFFLSQRTTMAALQNKVGIDELAEVRIELTQVKKNHKECEDARVADKKEIMTLREENVKLLIRIVHNRSCNEKSTSK